MSARGWPRLAGLWVLYEPQPGHAAHPGTAMEWIIRVHLIEPLAVGQGHRAENGTSLIVLAVVLECSAGIALPALRDEAHGLLDRITVLAHACVNPDPSAATGRPRPVLNGLPAVEKSPRPGLANTEHRPRRRGRWRTHGALTSFPHVGSFCGSIHETRGEIRLSTGDITVERAAQLLQAVQGEGL